MSAMCATGPKREVQTGTLANGVEGNKISFNQKEKKNYKSNRGLRGTLGRVGGGPKRKEGRRGGTEEGQPRVMGIFMTES